ncbi:TPA: hypothetical protein ACGO4R_001868 [Streptococcus suis]
MDEKNTRIRMRFNAQINKAIQEFKLVNFGNKDMPVPDSFILTEAYKKIKSKIELIDWEKISEVNLSTLSQNNDNYTPVNTTLSLDQDTLSGYKELQNKLHSIANSRIFLSYVVKLVLFSAVLESKGELNKYYK